MIKSDHVRMRMIRNVGYLHAMKMFRNLKQCDACGVVISEYTRCDVCTIAAKKAKALCTVRLTATPTPHYPDRFRLAVGKAPANKAPTRSRVNKATE